MRIGAFKSSPIISILAESGEPNLSIRRQQLVVSYYVNIKSNPKHPMFEENFETQIALYYENHSRVTKPQAYRAHRYRTESHLDYVIKRIDKRIIPKNPPLDFP